MKKNKRIEIRNEKGQCIHYIGQYEGYNTLVMKIKDIINMIRTFCVSESKVLKSEEIELVNTNLKIMYNSGFEAIRD